MNRKVVIQIVSADDNEKQPMYWLQQNASGDIVRCSYNKETGHETIHTARNGRPGEYHYTYDRKLGIEKVVWKKTFDFRTFKGIEPLATLVLAPIFQSQGLGPRSCDLILTFNIQSFVGKEGRPIPAVTPILFEVTRDPRRKKELEEKCRTAVGEPCAFYLCKKTVPWLAFVANWKEGTPK